MSSPSRPEGGFSLLEVMIALLVLVVLASGIAIPLAAQLHARRLDETRRQLDEARDALLGFAAAHGRLPCPATDESRGLERFAAGSHAGEGRCADFFGGLLPAATLGLSPLDADGFARDPWDTPRNRIRYAVFGGETLNGVADPFTRTNGLQMATLPGLATAPHFLFICASGASSGASGCGPAANQLTRRAAVVLWSAGANGHAAAMGDEARNADGDGVFVSRGISAAEGNPFDDIVQWIPVHIVVNRLIVAGRLP